MKKWTLGFVSGITATLMFGMCVFAFAGGSWKTIDVLENDITVVVDGKRVEKENFVYKDTTYLPLRAVAEAVDKQVYYDENTNTAYIGTLPDETSGIKFYEEISGVPDFGYYMDTTPNFIDLSEKSCIYNYPAILWPDACNKYFDVLEFLGFELVEGGGTGYYFVKDNYFVSIQNASVATIVVAGVE